MGVYLSINHRNRLSFLIRLFGGEKMTQEELKGRPAEFVQHPATRSKPVKRSVWSQSLYETLARTAPVGIFQTDEKGDCIYVNERWCEIAGMSPEESTGTGWMKGLHPEDVGKVSQEWYLCAENNLPFKLEYRFQHAEGVVTWVLGEAAAVREKSGEVTGYVGTITEITGSKSNEEALRQYRDHLQELVQKRTAKLSQTNQVLLDEITERKRIEEALRESEARYRAIVEDQTELICRFMPGGTMTFVNEAYCRYFAKSSEELIGHTFMPFIPYEDREKVAKHFASLSARNPVATHEHRVITPAGEIRLQQWSNRVILDDQNQIIEYQAVGRDITEQKVMEQELKSTSEKIKLFAYSVSHDLKNPANALHGLTKLLKKRYGHTFDEKAKQYCDHIMNAAEQVDSLVKNINIYITTKEKPLQVENVSLKKIFQIIHTEFTDELDCHSIKWIEPQNPPVISADKLLLLRVFRNLVDNALKYGGKGLNEIRMGYETSDEFHILSVKDNGAGIRKEDSEMIFGVFQRQKSDHTVAGAGLGLAIVKEIAEQLRGKVWLESDPGQGATFYITVSKHL